jgi:hypothetical protein
LPEIDVNEGDKKGYAMQRWRRRITKCYSPPLLCACGAPLLEVWIGGKKGLTSRSTPLCTVGNGKEGGKKKTASRAEADKWMGLGWPPTMPLGRIVLVGKVKLGQFVSKALIYLVLNFFTTSYIFL